MEEKDYLIEAVELKTSRKGDNYLELMGNSGEDRKLICVWNIPAEQQNEEFQHRVIHIKTPHPYNGTLSQQWTDCSFTTIEELEEDHPIRNIKIIGDTSGEQLAANAVQMMKKCGCDKFWVAFVKSAPVQKMLVSFGKYQAAHKAHHTYPQGLSTHVNETLLAAVALMKTPFLSNVRKNVVLVALMFHDYGKVLEYDPNDQSKKRDNLYLYGHHFLSAEHFCNLYKNFANEWKNNPKKTVPATARRNMEFIVHAILAHHGKREYGAVVEPANIEAKLVYMCDHLSAVADEYATTANMDKNFFLGERNSLVVVKE